MGEDTVAGKQEQPKTAEQIGAEREQAHVDEWSQWVAVEPIYWDGQRAHNPGDAVPAANVTAHGWDAAGLVRRRR